MKNKEAKRAYDKIYNQKNAVKKRAQNAAWRNANKEKMQAYRDKWKLENPEKHKSALAKYRAANLVKVRAATIRCHKANPKKYKADSRKWWLANKPLTKIYSQRRKARKITNSTPEQIASADAKILQMLSARKTLCAYCSKEFKTSEMHVDHVLALARGGAHSAENIRMACENCICSKGDKILFLEWRPPQPLLLPL